jgi:hypothetical protein
MALSRPRLAGGYSQMPDKLFAFYTRQLHRVKGAVRA